MVLEGQVEENVQICSSEEVGHGRTLLIKMAEVTLIDFLYLNRLALSTFIEVGPQFSNQDSRLGPVIEKAKKHSIYLASYDLSCSTCQTSSVYKQLQPLIE